MDANAVNSHLETLSIRQEGEKVLVIWNGRLLFEMPWQAALELSSALYQKAKLAEEVAKAEQVAQDSAILLRATGMALTNNPDILDQANQIATHDLKRYIPEDKRK